MRSDPETYLRAALGALEDAVREVDDAIDHGYSEDLEAETLDVIRKSLGLFSWCAQFLEEEYA